MSVSKVQELNDQITRYAEAGVDELIIHFNPGRPLGARKETLSEFMAEVAPQFSD